MTMSQSNTKLVDSLKLLIAELREEEADALKENNQGAYSGLTLARVKLEQVLESNGIRRPRTL